MFCTLTRSSRGEKDGPFATSGATSSADSAECEYRWNTECGLVIYQWRQRQGFKRVSVMWSRVTLREHGRRETSGKVKLRFQHGEIIPMYTTTVQRQMTPMENKITNAQGVRHKSVKFMMQFTEFPLSARKCAGFYEGKKRTLPGPALQELPI